jgi:hypothetical protein
MSDTYHYEDGAVHHDHKRVINIDHIGGDNLGKLLSDFWKDDAEEADVVEVANAMAETKDEGERDKELFHFVHPELGDEEAWRIHDAVKRVVKLQGIQMICQYLSQLRQENKVLLPPNPSAAYNELVRMGMPTGEGFNEITFRKYYNKK